MSEGSNRDALPPFQGEASWEWGPVWGHSILELDGRS